MFDCCCVWELLGVWMLGTVCCGLEASEFELCGLIGRENHRSGAVTGSGHAACVTEELSGSPQKTHI